MNSRLSRYRAEWKLMNGAQQRTLILALSMEPMLATVCGIAVAEGNWLAACLALGLGLAEAVVILQVRSVAMWRHLYESLRDRPRAENWREN